MGDTVPTRRDGRVTHCDRRPQGIGRRSLVADIRGASWRALKAEESLHRPRAAGWRGLLGPARAARNANRSRSHNMTLFWY
jgi:hypothetical protein